MPVLSSAALQFSTLANETTTTSTQRFANATAMDTNGLHVVCAWPVSGQYGPGSRILYYTLVATCVIARKAEWLRNACLAAALVFPAVAALHGIVLAILHVDGAVDMDIYGAFQLSSIAILAAPVTVRMSNTYFFGPGRNIIFVWTGLVLAGLLSLVVEFYRSRSVLCGREEDGGFISANPNEFPYDDTPSCGLVCSQDAGPWSPMRKDATAEIYVIPAPERLDFGTGTLLAAACCIPAILSLASIMNKIREVNWRKLRLGDGKLEPNENDTISGTNGATIKDMKTVNDRVRFLLSTIEIPLFAGAVIAILIIGERNFWSPQVNHGTEPIESVGQWAPIVTAGLAALGSLYLLWEKDAFAMEEAENSKAGGSPPPGAMQQCNCSHCHNETWTSTAVGEGPPGENTPPGSRQTGLSLDTAHDRPLSSPTTEKDGNRKVVATWLYKAGKFIGTPDPEAMDDSRFRAGLASNFPELPGERRRNPNLAEIREKYNPQRDSEGRALSVIGSRTASPRPSIRRATSPHDGPPRGISPGDQRLYRTDSQVYQLAPTVSLPAPQATRGRAKFRRNTLEVPAIVLSPSIGEDGLPKSSPAIVVSSEMEESPPVSPTTPVSPTLNRGEPSSPPQFQGRKPTT